MQVVTSSISVSIDGFISGPRHPDEGFDRIRYWVNQIFGGNQADAQDAALFESR